MTGTAGRDRDFLREGSRQRTVRLMTLDAIDTLHIITMSFVAIQTGRQMVVRFMALVAIESPPVRGRVLVHSDNHILMTTATDPTNILNLAEITDLRAMRIMTLLAILEGKVRILARIVTT